MPEHTTAGKEFVARIVHQLVPTMEQDFWSDDPNKGDVIQHLCFFIEGKYGVHRIAFMTSSLDECAHPRNRHERRRVEQYIRQKVSALLRLYALTMQRELCPPNTNANPSPPAIPCLLLSPFNTPP